MQFTREIMTRGVHTSSTFYLSQYYMFDGAARRGGLAEKREIPGAAVYM